jgi:mannose-6-phosphate isomerase-like protein (cupin superfamily)
MAGDTVNLQEKFDAFSEHWSPKVVGELNGQQVKLAKLKGAFVWHHHAQEDELFYGVRGTLRMAYRDQIVTVREGEFLIVPSGVERKPMAEEEGQVMLFEPATTVNTGNVTNAFTRNGNEQV